MEDTGDQKISHRVAAGQTGSCASTYMSGFRKIKTAILSAQDTSRPAKS